MTKKVNSRIRKMDRTKTWKKRTAVKMIWMRKRGVVMRAMGRRGWNAKKKLMAGSIL